MGHFLLFYPTNSPKNQNFEKMKTIPGDIIILHMCNKNYDQMMYGSWDMVRDRCNCYFSFWAIFCPKAPGDIIILHDCSKNYDQIMYSSWDMVHNRHTEKVTYRGGRPTSKSCNLIGWYFAPYLRNKNLPKYEIVQEHSRYIFSLQNKFRKN